MKRTGTRLVLAAAIALGAACNKPSVACRPGEVEREGACVKAQTGLCGEVACGPGESCVGDACVPAIPTGAGDAGPEPDAAPSDPAAPGDPAVTEPDAGGPAEDPGTGAPGWVTVYEERFDSADLGSPAWVPDTVPDDGPFSDHGVFFRDRGVEPPVAWRISHPFGEQSWLTLESYTREGSAPFSRFAAVVADPADSANSVLRIASAQHTDATVVRPSQPLPETYRVSLRVGFPDFGDGREGLNGYDGGETAEPWSTADATSQNGFYWLAILDAQPRPHNNVWIHHHRKVVVDSDNHYPAWMEIFDGSRFVASGENPVMMFALDGRGDSQLTSGNPFLSYSGGSWQPSGKIRAVDSYLPGEWYEVAIERRDATFTLEVSGRFRHGGRQTYRASIDAAASCVWHYNRPSDTPAEQCVDNGFFPNLGADHPRWPAGASWQDWFMFGDPHSNYYEGEVLFDDVKLQVWRD